jgi:hypothetical protein
LVIRNSRRPELGRAEPQRLSGPAHPVLGTVELDVPEGEKLGRLAGLRPAEQRPDPGKEFRDGEGLDHVVVGAGREAANPVPLLAARGQHDDGQPLRLPAHAQPPAELDPGETREHPVQDQQVRDVFADDELRLVAARRDLDVAALRLKVVAQENGERFLVLCDQDARLRAHLVSPLTPPPRRRPGRSCGRPSAARP